MNDILDETEVQNNQVTFSKVSLLVSVITFGLIAYLFSTIPKTLKASEGIIPTSMVPVFATQLSCIIGIVVTGLSFIRKEKSTWYKWVGGVLNILLFLTIVGLVIFSLMAG